MARGAELFAHDAEYWSNRPGVRSPRGGFSLPVRNSRMSHDVELNDLAYFSGPREMLKRCAQAFPRTIDRDAASRHSHRNGRRGLHDHLLCASAQEGLV